MYAITYPCLNQGNKRAPSEITETEINCVTYIDENVLGSI